MDGLALRGCPDSCMTIQATRIGDYYFPVFGSEVSVEQSLYTNARTSFNDVMSRDMATAGCVVCITTGVKGAAPMRMHIIMLKRACVQLIFYEDFFNGVSS